MHLYNIVETVNIITYNNLTADSASVRYPCLFNNQPFLHHAVLSPPCWGRAAFVSVLADGSGCCPE